MGCLVISYFFCAEWAVLLVCEVVKGYFSFVFPVPRPNRRIHGVADNNSTKGMERVLDMLLVFFCTGHGNFPLSSTKGCGLIYDVRGGSTPCCRPLIAYQQRRAGLSTAAQYAPFILTVDWLGWLCYSFLYDFCLVGYTRLIVLNTFIEGWNSEKHGNKNIYQNDNR